MSYIGKDVEISVLQSWREFLLMIAKEQPLTITAEEKCSLISPLLEGLISVNPEAPTNLHVANILAESYLLLLSVWKR